VIAVGRGDYMKLLPGARSTSVDELARQQGVHPVRSVRDMQADVWDSDEELDEFLAANHASRHADVD
jgi:hypothetical protein